MKYKFGDLVINGWASHSNPHKIGIVIKQRKSMITFTDGRGDFWTHAIDKVEPRLKKVGHLEINIDDIKSYLNAMSEDKESE